MTWPTPKTGWAEERTELAKKLWKEGHSATQVAMKLGGCSRNAVIGKMHRLGLSDRPLPSKPSKPRSAPRVTRRLSVIAMTPSVMQVIPADAAPIKPLPKRDYKPGAHACALDAMSTHQCRWPLGPLLEPSELFCGEPLDENRDLTLPPYCEDHMARAVSRRPKKELGALLRPAFHNTSTKKAWAA